MNDSRSAHNFQRLYSLGIDLLMITILQLTLGTVTIWAYRAACHYFEILPDHDVLMFLSQFCGAFFFIGYFTFSVGLFGNTVGKRIMNIKVVKELADRPLTLGEAYWRSLAYLMSSWTYMIGFILPWFRKDKKALHDLLCGTRVVQRAKNEELTEHQLELPLHSSVLQIRIPTTEQDHVSARTGTDP